MLTTQSQNCYREQIQKEMLTRLSWKKRYSHLYPSNDPQNISTEGTNLPGNTQAVLPPISPEGEGLPNVSPLMRPVSPKTRNALYQDSSHHGKGRSLYLQRRGNIRPEEKFDFPLLSSWEYGWRLGDYTLDYKTPSRAKSSVVKSTFYARNGVFSSPSASDSLG
ncbi:Protein ATP6V1FNB [Dissostichus eleginoides]|uniref:Protein ATP6V1FNB n=1 Tax=Dissostichus eleginoides TaxID=100907 RepID=A0AAD9FGS0_DISEL|nr:Protein ATP6V1FNB [Dissostichus eleginoides]